MENREVFSQDRLLIKGLSIESIPENRRPTLDDWKELQGGMPEIEWVNDELCKVIHRYVNPKDPSGTGPIVPTAISVVKEWPIKTISRTINGKQIEFPVALVWGCHGEPCESRSNTKYDRVKVK